MTNFCILVPTASIYLVIATAHQWIPISVASKKQAAPNATLAPTTLKLGPKGGVADSEPAVTFGSLLTPVKFEKTVTKIQKAEPAIAAGGSNNALEPARHMPAMVSHETTTILNPTATYDIRIFTKVNPSPKHPILTILAGEKAAAAAKRLQSLHGYQDSGIVSGNLTTDDVAETEDRREFFVVARSHKVSDRAKIHNLRDDSKIRKPTAVKSQTSAMNFGGNTNFLKLFKNYECKLH